MQQLVFDLKKYVLSQETNWSLSLFTWNVVDIFLWRFFHYVLIPWNSWLKKQGGILTFNDMFQTFWHLLCTIAQIASADAEIFHWAVFPPNHFVMFLHRLRQRPIAGQIVSALLIRILQESSAIRSGLLCPSQIKYSQWTSFMQKKCHCSCNHSNALNWMHKNDFTNCSHSACVLWMRSNVLDTFIESEWEKMPLFFTKQTKFILRLQHGNDKTQNKQN